MTVVTLIPILTSKAEIRACFTTISLFPCFPKFIFFTNRMASSFKKCVIALAIMTLFFRRAGKTIRGTLRTSEVSFSELVGLTRFIALIVDKF